MAFQIINAHQADPQETYIDKAGMHFKIGISSTSLERYWIAEPNIALKHWHYGIMPGHLTLCVEKQTYELF